MTEIENKIKLLLVDDESEFRLATAKALDKRGYAVTTAADGQQALELIRSEKPDILLLDLKMPGLTGIQTLEKIRAITQDLPVIILTGHGTFHDAITGIKLEIIDFLQKPVEIEQLDQRIRKLLKSGKVITLRERTIAELMVPASLYPKLFIDEPIEKALCALKSAFYTESGIKAQAPATRSALVFDRKENFLGLLRFPDILKVVLPDFLDSPYVTYFTGMFLAQCKMIGKKTVGDILSQNITIDLYAPLMEAVHLMIQHNLITLPVMQGTKLMGIIREKDIILEIAEYMGIVERK